MKAFDSFLGKMEKVVEWFDGWLLIVITAMVFIQVIFRYVLHASMGGAEELPSYMLIALIWMAGIAVSKNDDYIKIDLITSHLSPRKAAVLNAFNSLLTAVCAGYYFYLDIFFIKSAIKRGTVSTGLKFPIWWIYSVTLVASFLTAVCFIFHTIESIRRAAE